MIGNYWAAFAPKPSIGLAEYSIRHIFNEEGRPFNYLQFWHMVAPGGPMDAFDSPYIRELVMQWASRLGKTFVILCGSIYLIDLAPCNQILAGNGEQLGLQQTERVRQMGEMVPHLKPLFLKTQKRRMRCNGGTIYAAWAKSPVTLSNINAMFGGASELDLWVHATTSKHPDPEEMFGDRFKNEDSRRKEIYESIPTLKGNYVANIGGQEVVKPRSRIEARRLKGSDCRLWVGCPLCDGRQVLSDDRITPTGYRCEHCDKLIPDERRKEFIRSGVWAPRGCRVDPVQGRLAAERRLQTLAEASKLDETSSDPAIVKRLNELREKLRWRDWSDVDYLIGEPENNGAVWSSQLSSFYALSLTWRRIAEVRGDGRSQNYINQWRGETIEVEEVEQIDLELESDNLARDISSEIPAGRLPPWTAFLIFVADKQVRTYPWQVQAWDQAGTRVHVVDRGDALAFDDVQEIVERTFDGRRLDWALMDCGYLENDVYDFCTEQTKRQPFKFWPVKGDKASVVKLHFVENRITDEIRKKSLYRNLKRVHVNSQSTQEWMNVLLEKRTHITLAKAKPSHQKYTCTQLLNEFEIKGRVDSRWERINRSLPNDHRDLVRYGFVGVLICKKHKRGGTVLPRDENVPDAATARDGLLAKNPQLFRMVGPANRPDLKSL